MSSDGTPPWAWVVGLIVATMVLSTVAVVMRIYTRLKITKSFGLDDWFLLATHVICMTGCVVYLWIETHKYNYEPRSPELYNALSAPFLVCLFTYMSSSVLLKLSLAVFFLRLAQNKIQRYIIICTAAAQLLILTIILLVNMLRCNNVNPVQILTKVDCAIRPEQLQPIDWVMIIATAAFDWVFAIIPIVLVARSIGMSLQVRLAACCLIILAIIGSTISLVRLPYIKDLSYGPDFFENETAIAVLCLEEVVIGTLAIALATTKPLWQIWGRKLRSHVSSGKTDNQTSTTPMPTRLAPKFIGRFKPTVDYDKVDIDMDALQHIGVLPDIEAGSRLGRSIRSAAGGGGFSSKTRDVSRESDTVSLTGKKDPMTSVFEVDDFGVRRQGDRDEL